MAIEGDVRDSRTTAGVSHGFAAEVLLGLAAVAGFLVVGAALVLANQRTFGGDAGSCSLAAHASGRELWRWVGFIAGDRDALWLTTPVNVQAAAFVVVFTDHVHSEVAVITAWGLGGLAGALYGLRRSGFSRLSTGVGHCCVSAGR